VRSRDVLEPQDFFKLAEGIELALVRFESTSNHALLRIYRSGAHGNAFRPSSPTYSTHPLDGHNTLLTEDEDEHVFLVYLYAYGFTMAFYGLSHSRKFHLHFARVR